MLEKESETSSGLGPKEQQAFSYQPLFKKLNIGFQHNNVMVEYLTIWFYCSDLSQWSMWVGLNFMLDQPR